MSTLFTENRNLFHTFSRVAIQEGQGVAAAVNKTGHTVTTNDVWAEISKLPKNTKYEGNANKAYTDLKKVYDANSTEFSKYVKLYENAVLSPVDGSGQDFNKNQAWELLVDGKRVKNFVAPTDVFDDKGQPCNGYTLQLFDKNGTQIPATDGNWAFDYVAGLVIFERGKTPQDMDWASTSSDGVVTPIKITAWAYVGEYLNETLDSHDSRLDAVESQLGLGGGDGVNGSITERVEELEATVSAYTSENTISGAITGISSIVEGLEISGSDAITVSPNKLTETPVISLKVAEGSNAIDITSSGLSSFLELDKEGSTISLKANGKVIDSFNLDIDRVVTSGAYIPSSEQLKLSFTSGNDVFIPVGALVDEYSAGDAISITDDVPGKNEISVIPGTAISVANNKVDVIPGSGITLSGNAVEVARSSKSEEFFYINETGVGVSGVQDAIDLAASSIISSVIEIPTTVEGFKYNTLIYTEAGETAIVDVKAGKIVDISEENVDAITLTSPSGAITTVTAVTGYVEKATSGILPDAKKYADDNFLKEVIAGNGIEVSAKANKTQTISILPDPADGNLVQVTENGIYVSASEYELQVADVNRLGGILEGQDLLIDQTGLVTVLSANQVKHDLKFGGKIYNGSAKQTILASDLGALTGVTAGNAGITVVNGAELEKVVKLKVKDNDPYLEITPSGLASKGIDLAITDYVDPRVDFLSGVLSGYDTVSAVISSDIALAEAIATEAAEREAADDFLSGVLSGYNNVSAVKNADDALSERLTNVESQLGGGSGTGSVTEKLAAISGVLSSFTGVGSVSGAITSEAATRDATDKFISGAIDDEVAARKAADTYISGAVDDEVAARKAADTYISGAVDYVSGVVKPLAGLTIQKNATAEDGFAATYRLTDAAGNTYGELINIPRDQFLSGATYDHATKSLKLTFALSGLDANDFPTVRANVATIPVSSLVHEYGAGAGLSFNEVSASFNVEIDEDSEKYLYITDDGIGLSGIQDALDGVTASVENTITPAIDFLSGVLSSFTGVGSVSGAIDDEAEAREAADEFLSGAIDTLNGNSSITGSVLYAIKTNAQFADYKADDSSEAVTIQYAIRQNTAAITTLNGGKDVEGSVDYKIDQYDNSISGLLAQITTLNTNIDNGVK